MSQPRSAQSTSPDGPSALPEDSSTAGTTLPTEVVAGFLDALAASDMERAVAFLADDIVYTNVSLPTIRGRTRFERGARVYYRRGLGFEVVIHRIAAAGPTVLTERTDALTWGPWRSQFWVCGTFEVVDGKIALWRDYFDWMDVLRASVRGLVGILIPALRASFPTAS